ncbi:DEKNAAC101408 [Brettanomyces naardenensis]|uniref:DEKNAAC101408 n=1 Tax=Brettanomyces naardenensis TaxID=13370 RepID=A0A448YI99_BRENA|nr:DEKNAAC101408 [Brettanomyces naardenensis]
MFHRKKNKPLEFNLGDSNYHPAPNPNTLAPQPATGQIQRPHTPANQVITSANNSPPQGQYNTFTNAAVKRPVPYRPPPPTVINNYYYVQPPPNWQNGSGGGAGQGQKRSGSSNVTDGHVRSSTSRRPTPKPIASRMPPAGFPDGNGDDASDIYSSSSLVSPRMSRKHGSDGSRNSGSFEARLPDINMNDGVYRSQGSDDDVYVDLIGDLCRMDDATITVHSTQLLTVFQAFGKDLIDSEDLRNLLLDPGTRRRFARSSSKSLSKVFSSRNSPGELDFRGFIKLCSFVKGCFDSFNYYDRDYSHTLEYEELVKALQFNGMPCPSELMARIFKYSDYVTLEGFIMAVIIIRRAERGVS